VAEEKREDTTIVPKSGVGDIAHLLARAGLSMVPVFGGAAKEIFAAIVAPPIIKRREEWMEEIGRRLKELEEKIQGFSFEKLSENEVFVTTAMYATTIAIRNHQDEKIEALRNAVLNAALPSAPEEDLQLMFLSFVDAFTPWHLRILKFFDDPREWMRTRNITMAIMIGGPSSALEFAFPELKNKRSFYDQVVRDLASHGLVNEDTWLHATMSGSGMLDSRTSDLGKNFINFVSKPRM
jgi:hypothetical protein